MMNVSHEIAHIFNQEDKYVIYL